MLVCCLGSGFVFFIMLFPRLVFYFWCCLFVCLSLFVPCSSCQSSRPMESYICIYDCFCMPTFAPRILSPGGGEPGSEGQAGDGRGVVRLDAWLAGEALVEQYISAWPSRCPGYKKAFAQLWPEGLIDEAARWYAVCFWHREACLFAHLRLRTCIGACTCAWVFGQHVRTGVGRLCFRCVLHMHVYSYVPTHAEIVFRAVCFRSACVQWVFGHTLYCGGFRAAPNEHWRVYGFDVLGAPSSNRCGRWPWLWPLAVAVVVAVAAAVAVQQNWCLCSVFAMVVAVAVAMGRHCRCCCCCCWCCCCWCWCWCCCLLVVVVVVDMVVVVAVVFVFVVVVVGRTLREYEYTLAMTTCMESGT